MGKGYKRKTRWRTLNIGAPPGEEDEEDGIRNGYAKGQENGTVSRNGQTGGHKTGRTDSAGSATSDYASDYASAASRSRRDDSGGSPAQPKIIFDENEYTRITTPRQDVLFKKGYLSRRKVWASTASTSATPSTTESQSASHSTADGSETTEDQQLLDCKENGAEEYPTIMEPGAQVAYGTFYDHASGYYYEYPVMVVGPGPVMPGGPPIHNILTAVPCGPVPLRPIEWINPAFVPKMGNEQYCVVDYQTAQLGQYPTLVDENGIPLTAEQTENTNGSDEAYHENGNGSESWAGSVVDEEPTADNDNVNDTTQDALKTESSMKEVEEVAEESVNSEVYLATALAQQLHMTHVAVPPIPEPYVYPGHYMFGPSLINVNGITLQSGPMVRNAGISGGAGPTNSGACAKRRKKKKLSRRKSRRPLGPGNAEDEEQEEEEEYCSEADNPGLQGKPTSETAGPAGIVTKDPIVEGSSEVTTNHGRPLNPECQEFRPIVEALRSIASTDVTRSNVEDSSTDETSTSLSSSVVSTDKEPTIPAASESTEKLLKNVSQVSSIIEKDPKASKATRTTQSPMSDGPSTEKGDKSSTRHQNEEIEAVPVDFAAEVFANVSIMAERALASRSVVEGTPMETEIGLDATSVDFQEIVESLASTSTNEASPISQKSENNGSVGITRIDATSDEKLVSNGHDEESPACERTAAPLAEASSTSADQSTRRSDAAAESDRRGSRSASPGMINRTTTPINANSQRLPESYESLVTRGGVVSGSLPCVGNGVMQQPRNRKYNTKGPKFVREATPGPDLETVDNEMENSSTEKKMTLSETARRIVDHEDEDDVATGVEALEGESQRYVTKKDGESPDKLYANNDQASKVDTAREIRGTTSDHPITDAVTEWLHRANSPELFVTRIGSDSSDAEDDELENEEPSKNLQGNPMPALSANVSGVKDSESSRAVGHGKFALTTNDVATDIIDDRRVSETTTTTTTTRRKRDLCRRRGRAASKMASNDAIKSSNNAVDVARSDDIAFRLSNVVGRDNEKVVKTMRTIVSDEFTGNDSVAGMRVAKSSRTRCNNKMASLKTTRMAIESSKGRKSDDKTRITKIEEGAGSGRGSRDVPCENVDVKVRVVHPDDANNDEGIVEDEEVGVRTFEKGEIVVSIDGKVLPIDSYDAVSLIGESNKDGGPKFSRITCERSVREEKDETSESDNPSKRNSLGSIEEPDVLECWEIETVEPITTPKKNQARGTSHEGEANEDDRMTSVDPVGAELVRKYYRLEAMRDSGTSVTSVDDYSYKNEQIDSPCNTISSADDIPVIGEIMSPEVERMFEKSGIPIDEAVEVYESLYGGRKPSYILDFKAKYGKRGFIFGQNRERDGNVPCKAACCNIQ